MFHPFIDTSSLSDDDLVTKTNELYVRLAHCESHGQHQGAQEIRLLIASLEAEYGERINKQAINVERKNNNELSENEPITLGKLKDEDDGTGT